MFYLLTTKNNHSFQVTEFINNLFQVASKIGITLSQALAIAENKFDGILKFLITDMKSKNISYIAIFEAVLELTNIHLHSNTFEKLNEFVAEKKSVKGKV